MTKTTTARTLTWTRTKRQKRGRRDEDEDEETKMGPHKFLIPIYILYVYLQKRKKNYLYINIIQFYLLPLVPSFLVCLRIFTFIPCISFGDFHFYNPKVFHFRNISLLNSLRSLPPLLFLYNNGQKEKKFTKNLFLTLLIQLLNLTNYLLRLNI